MRRNMIRSGRVILLFAALGSLMAASGTVQKAEDPGVLLRAAIEKEEVDGDLPGAIDAYKKIIAQYGEDRAIAAKALLRLGGCYEKLGEEQLGLAQKAYEKLVADYPDQADAVSTAKAKLAAFLRAQAAIEKGGGEYKITKIHEVGKGISGWLSPDGMKLVLNDENTFTLSLRDVASGQETCLIPPSEPLTDCWWSPDGKLIAYFAYSGDIKIVPADGGPPRTLIKWDSEKMEKAGRYPWPMGWTSDSQKLIFQVSDPVNRTKEGLYAIPVQGGEWEEIYKFPDPQKAGERDGWPVLSPDGTLLAIPSTRDGNRDIYVMPAKGGESVRITDDPANDGGPAWSYDGLWLAFQSDRTGRGETWVIRITPDGRPAGVPVQATRGGGSGTWTRDGKIAYSTETSQTHVYIANADGSRETQLTKLKDTNISPRWSSDGKTMAFAASYGPQAKRTAVWTMPVSGGDEKFLAIGAFPVWSPDGKEIAFGSEFRRVGEPEPHRAIISIIPASGGEPREIMNYHGELSGLDWSPDGRQIVFSYQRVPGDTSPIPDSRDAMDIYAIPVAGGEPRRLTRGEKETYEFMAPCWSPDGKKIAFLWMDREGVMETGQLREPARIYTMNIEGEDHKLITNEDPMYWFCWSPDGTSIIFPSSGRSLCKVPAEGGKAEQLKFKGGGPAFSPDGKKIAYYKAGVGRVEFWLAEGFLPTEKKGN